MIIFIIIAFVTIAYICYRYERLRKASGSLDDLRKAEEHLQGRLSELDIEFQEALRSLEEVQVRRDEKIIQISEGEAQLIAQREQQAELNTSLSVVKEKVQNQLELLQSYQKIHDQVKLDCEERCQAIRQQSEERLAAIEQECAKLIGERRMAAQAIADQLASDVENERRKYLSLVATIQNAQTASEKEARRHINIKENARDDIGYLLNNVANHLSNPDILYKLIWSEYIQKPTNEMLDYVLPNRDCAGIYKITNDRNKKSYIGRSTSVRKRLTDHVKSAVGISTIANQKIHDIMREEGLWDFTFELIEECNKDELSDREKYYIDFFQTADTTYGYNQKAGG